MQKSVELQWDFAPWLLTRALSLNHARGFKGSAPDLRYGLALRAGHVPLPKLWRWMGFLTVISIEVDVADRLNTGERLPARFQLEYKHRSV